MRRVFFFATIALVVLVVASVSAASSEVDCNAHPFLCHRCVPFTAGTHRINPNKWNILSGIQSDAVEQKPVFFQLSLCSAVVIPNASFKTPSFVAVNPHGAPGIPPFPFNVMLRGAYDRVAAVYRLVYASTAKGHTNDRAEVEVSCGGATDGIAFAGPDFYPSKNPSGGLTAKFKLVSRSLCIGPAPPPPAPTTPAPTPAPTAIPANGTTITVLAGRLTLEYTWVDDVVEWTLSSPTQAGRYFALARSYQGMSHGLGVACVQPSAGSPTTNCTALATHEWGVGSREDDTLMIVSADANVNGRAVVKVRLSASGMNITSGSHRLIYAIGNWNAPAQLPHEHAFDDRNYGNIIFRQQ